MEIDTTQPNGGRIYDYYLGGNHNFAVDRRAAEHLLTLMPSAKPGARLNRWFLYDAVERLAQRTVDGYLDLASGLPTQGYLHDLVPNAPILYTDNDPVTVASGREIVAANPNVRYLQANITDLDSILAAADAHFGGRRRIAVSFIGAAYFFDRPTLQSILDRLFAWCAPGSPMALSFLAGDVQAFAASRFAEQYRQMNTPIYPLEVAEIAEVLAAWRVEEPGILPLSTWTGITEWRDEAGVEEQTLDLYGVLVTKG